MTEGRAEEDSDFDKLLGAFGANANLERRRRAEKLAAMKPTDRKRGGVRRPHQFNVRISDQTQALAAELCRAKEWSQADLVEAAVAALAKTERVKGAG